jgi:hypothetical protein
MADIREQILARLRAIAKVRGIGSVLRNAPMIGDSTELPAVILYDGDETVAETSGHKPTLQPYLVTMSPWFQIIMHAAGDDIGEELNVLRLRLLDAVLGDATLAALSLDNRGVRYAGALTKFTSARAVQGDMALRFSILYALKPSDLS